VTDDANGLDDVDDDLDFDESALDEDLDPLDDDEVRARPYEPDPDEVEADGLLQLDRKELNEAGLELDNPDGFADE
jgi:hypothetical protein